ncbi:YgaP-like transmembrane domain [Cesiribacter sp. SM1]|uniref:YgaP-like transmembrane domain n=1 Tax=Cesiribacter sp. SM1 TaxID=2861196 RepID=UPI001CD7F587|nr:YgaP-like transmembrane domain [Cesiribacter sp. SM1]
MTEIKANKLSDFTKDDLHLEPEITGSSHINVGTTERIVSVAAGAALLYLGFKKFSITNVLLGITGASFVHRGLTGHCGVNDMIGRNTASREGVPVVVKKSVTIGKPREEVYSYWRKLENLPNFMKHITHVEPLDAGGKRYHWQMEVPKLGNKFDWEAEIVEETANERILYRTYNGSDVSQSGEITFRDAPGGRGTELHATIKYYAPEGYVGGGVAKMLNPAIESVVHEDMRRFKHLMETGEIPTIEGQPSGRENKNY